MRTYEEAIAAARNVPAFSNGTEGEAWTASWCDRCIHDKPARQGRYEDGCPLVMVTLMSKTPAEFLDGPRDEQGRYGLTTQYTCVEFRDEDEPGPGYGPKPPAPLPGQEVLFDDEALHGARMFVDVVAEVVPAVSHA